MEELALDDEPALCAAHGIRFLSLPIPDRDVPESDRNAAELTNALSAELERGSGVLIHCRQGVGRSGMMAAALLIAAGLTPAKPSGALARPAAWPSQRQTPNPHGSAAWLPGSLRPIKLAGVHAFPASMKRPVRPQPPPAMMALWLPVASPGLPRPPLSSPPSSRSILLPACSRWWLSAAARSAPRPTRS